jgi:hypothetical protein
MNEAHCKPTVYRRFLKVFFQVTHFPPALEALNVLQTRNRLLPNAVMILASCFRELCLRMVPGCLIGGRFDAVLEGSRQIFAWLFEQCGSTTETLDDPQTALVRSVRLEELGAEFMEYYALPGKLLVSFTIWIWDMEIEPLLKCSYPTYKPNFLLGHQNSTLTNYNSAERVEIVEFFAEGEGMLEPYALGSPANNEDDTSGAGPSQTKNSAQLDQVPRTGFPATSSNAAGSSPTKSGSTRKVRVTVHTSCVENLKLLAMAMWGTYDHVTNYYVDFRENIEDPLSHRRTPLVDAADFESLILVANRSPRFLMLSPLELTDRRAQGITLCKEGYVSLYSINVRKKHLKATAEI